MKCRYIGLSLLAAMFVAVGVNGQESSGGTPLSSNTIAASEGTPISVSTSKGHDMILTFLATAGERMSLEMEGSTYRSTCPYCIALSVAVLKPDTGEVEWTSLSDGTKGLFLSPRTLPVSGIYRIVFHSQDASSGSAQVTVFLFKDQVGTLSSGATVPVSTQIPGQYIRLLFRGTAGQAATITLSSSTFGSCPGCNSLTAHIVSPEGRPIGSTTFSGSETTASIANVTLPSTGTYTLVIGPQQGRTGSVNANLTFR